MLAPARTVVADEDHVARLGKAPFREGHPGAGSVRDAHQPRERGSNMVGRGEPRIRDPGRTPDPGDHEAAPGHLRHLRRDARRLAGSDDAEIPLAAVGVHWIGIQTDERLRCCNDTFTN